jgi:hypothetical protein
MKLNLNVIPARTLSMVDAFCEAKIRIALDRDDETVARMPQLSSNSTRWQKQVKEF